MGNLPRVQAALNPCEEILFPLAAFSGVQSDDCSGVSLATEFQQRRSWIRRRPERGNPGLGGRNSCPATLVAGTSSWALPTAELPPQYRMKGSTV